MGGIVPTTREHADLWPGRIDPMEELARRAPQVVSEKMATGPAWGHCPVSPAA